MQMIILCMLGFAAAVPRQVPANEVVTLEGRSVGRFVLLRQVLEEKKALLGSLLLNKGKKLKDGLLLPLNILLGTGGVGVEKPKHGDDPYGRKYGPYGKGA